MIGNQKIIRGFKEFSKEKYHLQPQSVERYRCCWEAFFSFLAASKVEELKNVSPALIRKYREKLLLQNLSDTAKESRIRIVQRLFEYLTESNRLLINPAEGLERVPRNRNRPKVILMEKEITKLLKQPDIQSLTGFRDYLILELLISTGLTRAEFLSLNVFDVDLNKEVLYVRNKQTNRTRGMPLNKDVVKLLSRYIESIHPARARFNPRERGLFLTRSGKRLDRQGLYMLFKKYKDMAGIKNPVTFTSLRHGYAFYRLKEKTNIEDVSKLLGHKNTASTRVSYLLPRKRK